MAGAGRDARDAGHRRDRLGDARRRRRRRQGSVLAGRGRSRGRHGQLDLVVRRDRSGRRVRADARRSRDHPAEPPAAANRRAGPLDGGEGRRRHRARASGPDAPFAAPALRSARAAMPPSPGIDDGGSAAATAPPAEAARPTPFRFYDNRQKYLAFVTTCNEKAVIAQRCAVEIARLQPTPPALELFDAGMGDGTVLSRVLRTVHDRFPTVPVLAVAKEISLEDVRLGLEKLPDRFVEHPHTVLVVTNLSYADAPRLL